MNRETVQRDTALLQNVKRIGCFSVSLDPSGLLQIDYEYATKLTLDPRNKIIVPSNNG
jgi:hypothetical protein